MKKSYKGMLYFGLDSGLLVFLQIFFSQAVIQRTIVDFPTFLETGLEEKDCGLWPYKPWSQQVGELDAFLYVAGENLKNSRSKLKNQKPIAVDVLFQAYPMV